jgi:hypothetical protein
MKTILKSSKGNKSGRTVNADTSISSAQLGLVRARVSAFARKTQSTFSATLKIAPTSDSQDGVLAGTLKNRLSDKKHKVKVS